MCFGVWAGPADANSLRGRIGIVPQNADLFADTIMNNVRYSNMNANDEEVREACKAACIHDSIETFTDGRCCCIASVRR